MTGGAPPHLGEQHLGEQHLGEQHLGEQHLGEQHLGEQQRWRAESRGDCSRGGSGVMNFVSKAIQNVPPADVYCVNR
jgi:hypothetical protein